MMTMLSEKQQRQAIWWRGFFARIGFPDTGYFFIVPQEDDAPWNCSLVHALGRKIDFVLDHGETWAQSQAMFAEALPAGVVSLPACCDEHVAPRPDPRNFPARSRSSR